MTDHITPRAETGGQSAGNPRAIDEATDLDTSDADRLRQELRDLREVYLQTSQRLAQLVMAIRFGHCSNVHAQELRAAGGGWALDAVATMEAIKAALAAKGEA